MRSLERATTPAQVDASIQVLFRYIEELKAQNEEAHARNTEHKQNFRMSGLYFTPRGAITGCEKALEWLRESLKA